MKAKRRSERRLKTVRSIAALGGSALEHGIAIDSLARHDLQHVTATEDGEYIPKPDSVRIYLDLSLSSRNC
jgi:hypothetical protein